MLRAISTVILGLVAFGRWVRLLRSRWWGVAFAVVVG